MGEVILVSRTDRLGDLVLTLPVWQRLRQERPAARLLAHVRRYTAPLLLERPDIDGVLLDDGPGGPRSIVALARAFRRERIDTAILVHPAPRPMLATALAGIPVRIGRASNLWQFALTHRMVQHRSANRQHETEYNQALLAPLGIVGAALAPRVAPAPAALAAARAWLDARFGVGAWPVVIHPGGGGSALNLPIDRYVRLASTLAARGLPVVVSIGPGEEGLVAAFAELLERGAVIRTPAGQTLPDLIGLLAQAAVWVGGSTGPLHVAAALGRPTVAIFPPVAAMTPVRWGPWGNRARVLQPAGVDPCDARCRRCPCAPCWSRLADESLLEAIGEHLSRPAGRTRAIGT